MAVTYYTARYLAAAAASAILIANAAHACSCGQIATAVQARQYSTVVFEGTVVSKRIVLGKSRLGNETWILPLEEYTFSVTRSWKGPATAEIRLRQGYHNCDNAFSGGDTYLVFASTNADDPSAYSSGKCGPTKRKADALHSLAELGAPAIRFSATRRPQSTLGAGYFARLYFLSGLAVQRNVTLHPEQIHAWRSLGAGAVPAGVAIVAVVASVVVFFRRGKRAVLIGALLVLALILALSSTLVTGATVLSDGFYTHYKEWKSATQ